jgi:alpha/beta superfamily hydrolase
MFKITDIEVEFLKTAKVLHEQGFTILTFDLRNHGESQNSKDGIFGLGLNEWPDIVGALDFIQTREELKHKKISVKSLFRQTC